MKDHSHVIRYEVYDSRDDLKPEDLRLLEKAGEAVQSSHAPYSRYHVGAAVLLANGSLFTGSNQENMSFPAGLCAERAAVFAAMSAFPDATITALAITARAELFPVSEPVPPCGICRQAIVEYEMKFSNRIRIILGGETGPVHIFNGMTDLLPFAFQVKELIK